MISPRKAVIKIDEYVPPSSGREGYIRLDFNENTVGCSKKVIAKLKKLKAGNLSAYPEYKNFRKKLAKFLNINFNQVIPTNATDEAIKTVIETYIEKGIDEIIIPTPSFEMFKFYSQLSEAIIKEVPYNDNLSFPTKKILSQINPKTKIIVIVNPNNPTGTSIKKKDIIAILKKAKNNDALVMVDEAYFPFFNKTTISFIKKFNNLIVLQTFSKAFGLANARLGYIISNKVNIKNMQKVISPYSVNGIAVFCAYAAIDDYSYVKKYVKEINRNKKTLYRNLEKLKIKYYKSDANFLLINLGDKCDYYCNRLKEKGILVRNRSNDLLLQGCIRITIGTKVQINKLIIALKEIKEETNFKIAKNSLLIFDMDGVLVDVSDSYRQAIKKTVEFFTREKVSLKEIQDYKNMGGYNNDWDLAEAILREKNSNIEKRKIIDKFQEIYLSKLIKNEIWAFDKKIMKELAKNYEFAILTGRPKKEAIYTLKKNNTLEYFKKIVAMEDTLRPKPNPEGLLKIIKKSNSGKAYYFGDTIDDMKAASNAGINGIGVLPPGDKSNLLKSILEKNGADKVIENINKIKMVIQ